MLSNLLRSSTGVSSGPEISLLRHSAQERGPCPLQPTMQELPLSANLHFTRGKAHSSSEGGNPTPPRTRAGEAKGGKNFHG
eukprot:4752472-Amphidinium_carterae.1